MKESDFVSPAQHQQKEVLFDSGGTCDCYRLVKDNHVYCIKRPKKNMCSSEAYIKLFRKEFEFGIDLEHPNIVRYFAFEEDELGPFIRMDYIDGDSLESFSAQHPDYFKDKKHRKQFCDELFSALEYLHDKNMLHLDLKPSNILITSKGHHVKLIDLGFGWRESYLHDVGFTRDYCAPEQIEAKTDLFNSTTDIYAVGKILQQYGLVENSIVQQCLKPKPEDRLQSIEALRKAIRQRKTAKLSHTIGLCVLALLLVVGGVWKLTHKSLEVPSRPASPEGTINGLFTINEAGDQVYFSKGNLQYKPHDSIWRFAENQIDCIGGDNANVMFGAHHRGWLDLFGFSMNGREQNGVIHNPWEYQVNSDDSKEWPFLAYGVDTCDLNDFDGQADWGVNDILNGGDEEGVWRTLTIDEWQYILDERPTTTGIRFVKATVLSINGLLLLPDDWDSTYYHLSFINDDDVSFYANVIPSPMWEEKVESQGAVFLPAAGIRDIANVGLGGKYGNYWSSTHRDGMDAWTIYFCDSFFNHETPVHKCFGRSVRLVREK